MPFSPVQCSRCGRPLPPDFYNTGAFWSCPGCGATVRVAAFPALLTAGEPGRRGEKLVTDEQAGCYYHPQKKAVVPCDHCGRFLCALCDVELGTRHLCPTCYQAEMHKTAEPKAGTGAAPTPGNRIVQYDSMALASLFFFPVPFLMPVVALYLAIRHFRTPCSVLPRTRVRFVLAIPLALGQLAFWSWICFFEH